MFAPRPGHESYRFANVILNSAGYRAPCNPPRAM
jgi:hypothetical protein